MANTVVTSASLEQLEDQLNSFDINTRINALQEIARRVETGEVQVPKIRPEVNLHFHTFFSFNAYGWSPSRIAWEARKYGLMAAGIVDFDVLDGVEEFLSAGEIISIRSTASMETRVFINEYSDQVISSPNEPGVAYYMAGGAYKLPKPGTKAHQTLRNLGEMARKRNIQVMDRVNDYLDQVRLDYDTDVLPLTPSGNATERHMLAAYDAKSRKVIGDQSTLQAFWADKLEISNEEAEKLLSDTPKFHEKMRSKLMKFGGVGYVPPSPETFPVVDLVIDFARTIGAMPMATWLDGTNPGESDMPAMLDLLEKKGNVAMNIIPDRNWNIKDPEEKRIKLINLAQAVNAAKDLHLPLCIGTELNKAGLPFVDDFAAPELAPYIEDFIDGAYILWGHTVLARSADLGYMSEWADSYFGNDRAKRNQFYSKAGKAIDPAVSKKSLKGADLKSATPEEIIRILSR